MGGLCQQPQTAPSCTYPARLFFDLKSPPTPMSITPLPPYCSVRSECSGQAPSLPPVFSPATFPPPVPLSLLRFTHLLSSHSNSRFSRHLSSLPRPPCSPLIHGAVAGWGWQMAAGPGLIHHHGPGCRAEARQGNCCLRGGIFHR